MSTRLNSQSKSNLLGKIINRFKTPSRAIVSTWLIWLTLYITFPFYYTTSVSPATVITIIISIFSFILGDILSRSTLSRESFRSNKHQDSSSESASVSKKNSSQFNSLVRNAAIIGLVGASVVVFVKSVLSGLDFAGGVTSARFQRANDVLTGNVESSPTFLYPALLAFPFGTAAFLSGILNRNTLPNQIINISQLAILAPVAVTVVNGGRGGILQIIFMAIAAVVLLHYSDKSEISNQNFYSLQLKKSSIFFFVAFAAYSIYVFESRREVTGVESIAAAFYDWKINYGIYPAGWIDSLIDAGFIDGNFVINVMQSYYYITHGPLTFSKILDGATSAGLYYGQYQIGLLSPLVDKFIPALSLSEKIISETSQLGVTGLFPSAWGMMYLDFGLLGLLVESFILGWTSQLIYYNAINKQSVGAKLMFCFTFASILFSPMIAPLGFSDSSFTLVAILLFSIMSNLSQKDISISS
jgi:oligosaccharide repeat unit polymerase